MYKPNVTAWGVGIHTDLHTYYIMRENVLSVAKAVEADLIAKQRGKCTVFMVDI